MDNQINPKMMQAATKAGGLINQAFGMVIAMTSLRTVFEMGLQDIVPPQTPITADEIAESSGAEADLVVRLLRPLVALEIFEEVEPTVYRHSPLSLAFKDPNLRGYMQYGDSLFAYLGKNPVQAAVFNASMEHLAFPIAKIFPFASHFKPDEAARGINRNVLVDIGGGKGQASREILAECPALANKIILQDQASVLKELPEDLKGQVEPLAYDFFEPQPVKDAAFYYLRNVLCDWSDTRCIALLSNQAAAMGKHSRLLIATRVIPESKVDPMTAAMDICMLTYGGAERTAKQFTKLLASAGLAVEKVWTVGDSPWGIIEAMRADKTD